MSSHAKFKRGDRVIYSGALAHGKERLQTIEGPGALSGTWDCVFPGGGGRYEEKDLRLADPERLDTQP